MGTPVSLSRLMWDSCSSNQKRKGEGKWESRIRDTQTLTHMCDSMNMRMEKTRGSEMQADEIGDRLGGGSSTGRFF
ncbi:hypothetical protein L2E82_35274 [Cichorium intybus]|uniref:Uncharacterized protein n=1 Tax=Cichorium intybus TaxID=13427 RepID=A0ACB9BNL4_CICIN|nr:hypothetical protein L2E82_35274 [Cichorium intybus]